MRLIAVSKPRAGPKAAETAANALAVPSRGGAAGRKEMKH